MGYGSQKHLTNVYRSLPNVILCIVADKDCRMENINTLLTVSRKSKILRVSFFCKEIKKESAYMSF